MLFRSVIATELEEAPLKRELPARMARRLVAAKADQVAKDHDDAFIVAADTVVAVGRRVLPKPEDANDARNCLELLSGRRHRVLGAVAVIAPDGRRADRLVTTTVAFKRLAPAEIDAYLASDEWRGKAGAYAIQGRAAAFVRWINGSYSNVVGLPLFETNAILAGLGYPLSKDR